MEKKLEKLGKRLTAKVMKQIKGGGSPCMVTTDCANHCTIYTLQGYYCYMGTCQYLNCP